MMPLRKGETERVMCETELMRIINHLESKQIKEEVGSPGPVRRTGGYEPNDS